MPDSPDVSDKPFSFNKEGKFLDNHVDAGITVTASRSAAALLKANTPFPAGTTKIGGLSATVNGNTGDITFGGGKDAVSFSGSAGATSALTVYESISDLLSDLDPQRQILKGLQIDPAGMVQFMLLDWSYDIAASGSGSVALGAGATGTFAMDGSANGLFAVIRGFAAPPNARDGVESIIKSWMLPKQVGSVDDLQPGTWLIAEVDGSIAVRIGAQYGYNFNWIRNVNLSGVSGDVGLKIQAAVDAAVGFQASGKYLVVVGRESVDPARKTVRVRVFKMARKGWDFALNANVGVTVPETSLLPGQIDDFVAAVFGVHGAQIVEDLKLFDKWTDPATPLPELLSGFVSDFATRALGNFAASNPQTFQEARERIEQFIEKWENLGHSSSTTLMSIVQKRGGPAADLVDFARQSQTLDDAGLRSLIETELGKANFSSSAIGRWLESVAGKDVLSLLSSDALLASVRKAAQNVLSISDGKVLDNLIQFIDQKMHIPDVEKMMDQQEFDQLDPWLKDKLAKFLGKQQVLMADLDKIRASAKAIRDKASDLYQQARQAISHTYAAEFHCAYARTTTSTALMDVSFDFARNPGVGAFMKLAIQGDFKDLLLSGEPAITLQAAALTHGVARHSHVQIALPYFSDTIDHVNTSLATMNVVEDKGRLFVYDLQASDVVTRSHKWASNLTITGKVTTGRGVRVFVTDREMADSMTFGYSLRQSLKGMRDVQFEHQLQPLVGSYFPQAFGGPAAPAKASLHEWIGDLDNLSSAMNKTRTGNLGNVLLSLDVSLPGSVVAAWFKAPSDPRAPAYFEMSRNIQRALRRFTQFAYFESPAKYADLDTAPALFVYGCLPISTNIKIDGNALTLNVADKLYWDFEDAVTRQKMVFSSATRQTLAPRIAGVRGVLLDSDGFKGSAKFYDPSSLDRARQSALRNPVFHGLLFTEAETIRHAQEAALQLAKFAANAGTDPTEAIQALQDFGARITDAFNGGLGGLIPRLEEFSAMIFLEAARAFNPELKAIQPVARLDVSILKPSAPAPTGDAFLGGAAPDPAAVGLEQVVVGLP